MCTEKTLDSKFNPKSRRFSSAPQVHVQSSRVSKGDIHPGNAIPTDWKQGFRGADTPTTEKALQLLCHFPMRSLPFVYVETKHQAPPDTDKHLSDGEYERKLNRKKCNLKELIEYEINTWRERHCGMLAFWTHSTSHQWQIKGFETRISCFPFSEIRK